MSIDVTPPGTPSAAAAASALAQVLARVDAIAPELADLAVEHDRSGDFPAKSIQLLHDAGVLTATVGQQYGGLGLGHGGVQKLMVALGRVDPSAALIAHFTMVAHQAQAGNGRFPADFYAQLLADSRREPTLVNALQVEPELGTPSRGGIPATTARRTAEGWRITGRKVFSTGAPGLRWMHVLAATDEPEPRVGIFTVDARSSGIRVERTWAAAGMRATRGDDVIFTDVLVSADRVSGLEAPAGKVRDTAFGPGTSIPSIYIGVAEAARSWLVGYLKRRVPTNLGHPLIELPRFQAELGEMGLRLTAARELLEALATQADAGRQVPVTTAWAAKTLANRTAIWVVERAVSLIGNPGISTDNPLERHLRDVLACRVHFPQEDTVTSAFGRDASGQQVAR